MQVEWIAVMTVVNPFWIHNILGSILMIKLKQANSGRNAHRNDGRCEGWEGAASCQVLYLKNMSCAKDGSWKVTNMNEVCLAAFHLSTTSTTQ